MKSSLDRRQSSANTSTLPQHADPRRRGNVPLGVYQPGFDFSDVAPPPPLHKFDWPPLLPPFCEPGRKLLLLFDWLFLRSASVFVSGIVHFIESWKNTLTHSNLLHSASCPRSAIRCYYCWTDCCHSNHLRFADHHHSAVHCCCLAGCWTGDYFGRCQSTCSELYTFSRIDMLIPASTILRTASVLPSATVAVGLIVA